MMTPDREIKQKKPSDLAILGYNLGVFVVYTALCMAADNEGGVLAFFISLLQLVICSVIALITGRWAWFLGGVICLVIGFGTCVNSFHLNTR
jgi:hypothetical protein